MMYLSFYITDPDLPKSFVVKNGSLIKDPTKVLNFYGSDIKIKKTYGVGEMTIDINLPLPYLLVHIWTILTNAGIEVPKYITEYNLIYLIKKNVDILPFELPESKDIFLEEWICKSCDGNHRKTDGNYTYFDHKLIRIIHHDLVNNDSYVVYYTDGYEIYLTSIKKYKYKDLRRKDFISRIVGSEVRS